MLAVLGFAVGSATAGRGGQMCKPNGYAQTTERIQARLHTRWKPDEGSQDLSCQMQLRVVACIGR
jgi:hypothetical protein